MGCDGFSYAKPKEKQKVDFAKTAIAIAFEDGSNSNDCFNARTTGTQK